MSKDWNEVSELYIEKLERIKKENERLAAENEKLRQAIERVLPRITCGLLDYSEAPAVCEDVSRILRAAIAAEDKEAESRGQNPESARNVFDSDPDNSLMGKDIVPPDAGKEQPHA